jgi:hypothetical protein
MNPTVNVLQFQTKIKGRLAGKVLKTSRVSDSATDVLPLLISCGCGPLRGRLRMDCREAAKAFF